MNEAEELLKLEVNDLPPIKGLVLDDLHQKARKNFYLEIGSGPGLYLLSPSYSVLHPTANETIAAALVWRRPFCNVICPLGAILSLMHRYSAWRID